MANYEYSELVYESPDAERSDDATPRRDPDRPTRDEILRLREDLKTRYAKLHDEMKIDQDWIYAAATHQSGLLDDYIKGFPKGFTVKVLPLAELGVNVATDTLMVGEQPTVKVALPPDAYTTDAKRRKQKRAIKQWCEGFLFQVDNQAVESPWRDFVKKGFGLGFGCVSYTVRWDMIPQPPAHGKRSRAQKQAWAEYEHERKYCFPFDVHSVHPLNILIDMDNDPPEFAIEVADVDLRAITRKHPKLLEQHPEWLQKLRPAGGEAGATNSVVRTTYVSRKYFAQYVDDVPLPIEGADEDGVVENPMGYLWYRAALSGFGEQDDKGRLEYRIKGLVRNARDVMASFITNYNVTEVMRQITAFPGLMFAHPAGKEEADRQSEDFAWGPAKKFTMDNQLQVSPYPQVNVPNVVFQNQELANQLLQLLFGPDILKGVYRDDTASGQRTRLRQAQMPYQTMKVATEQAMAQVLTDILCAIRDEFDGPVTVWARGKGGKHIERTIKPSDIPAKFDLMIDLTPPTQEERDYLMKEGLTLMERGIITQERFIEDYTYADIEDIEEELISIGAERLMRLGEVEQWLAQLSIENVQKRMMAEQGQPMPPMQNATGNQPGMQGNQALPPAAPDMAVGPAGFTLDGAQPAPATVDSPDGELAGQPFMPMQPPPPMPQIRGV